MALRAGYYGLKRRLIDKIISIAGSYDTLSADVAALKTGTVPWMGVIPTTTDIDNLKTTGIYKIQSGAVNLPENVIWSSLIVISSETETNLNIQQMIIKGAFIYTRTFSGATPTWSAWYKLTGTAVTPAAKNDGDDNTEVVTKTTSKKTTKTKEEE